MTAYTIQSGTFDGQYQKRSMDGTQFTRVVDWTKLANGTTAGVNTDTATIIDIPKDFVATHAFIKVISACTTASYFSLSPFLATQTASNTAGSIVATAAATPTAYTAATAALITLASPAPHNGQVEVTICGYQIATI